MSAMGGGERLCCETMRAAKTFGHELTLLSGDFNPGHLERFFGFEDLFKEVEVKTYPTDPRQKVGLYQDLIRRIKAQRKVISDDSGYDLVFSTQDPGYIPDVPKPVIQWGYFPNPLPKGPYGWPLREHYARKIRRIGLVLAISHYSQTHLDRAWKIPSKLIYPACNMVQVRRDKEDLVVTAARGVPEKRLELFWDVAGRCPRYQFVLLLTQDPRFLEYSRNLQKAIPDNGRVVINPEKELYQETLARSKFYLHLMQGEHFGITIVEAMSAGCVPIVHDSGGPKEIIGDSGYLWQRKEDIPALLVMADRFQESLSDSAAKRARIFSRERFDGALGEVLGKTA